MYSGDEYYDDSWQYTESLYDFECLNCGRLFMETDDGLCPHCGADEEGNIEGGAD